MIFNKRIVITPGEPAGIGPDIIIMLSQKAWPIEIVVCADPKILIDRAHLLNLPIKLYPYKSEQPAKPRQCSELTLLSIKSSDSIIAGELDINNSKYVLTTLDRACDGCLNGEFAALITGPVHKRIINDAGYIFSGHTEYFAQRSKCHRTVMMFINDLLRVALVSTHLPLSEIPKVITSESLYETIVILNYALSQLFGINRPCIYVCGLNPHAGEGGYLGKEEIKIIKPTLDMLRIKGYNLIGPLPADTIFQPEFLQKADVVLAMYHDQGLPVIKYQGFGKSINITLGLPFIRTSVDHGTALTLAGTGQAKTSSIEAALNLTIEMIKKRYE